MFFYLGGTIVQGDIMAKNSNKLFAAAGGFAVGLVNGLFGAGGGVLAVPMLKKSGLSEKESHAGAIGVMLPLSAFSAWLYLRQGAVELASVYPFLPGGILGAVAGALFLKNINSVFLRGLFGAMMIYAGVRMGMA